MNTKNLIPKIVICLLAGLVCGETFLRVGDRFFSRFVPIPVIIGVTVLILLGALISAFVWHRRDKKNLTDTSGAERFWIGAIRYGIAFDLAMFGFQKIFHLQFITPLGMLDEPFSSMSNQWLTWSYFGRSYGFICTIAAAQILGSMLLLFNRTRLLGVIVLIPVMLNIIMIDYFYELDPGVLLHAVILFAGLIYLLLIDYDQLVEFFLKYKTVDTAVRTKPILKLVGRLSILAVPVLLIAFSPSPDRHPDLRGKYQVTEMEINGMAASAKTCSDSLLTVVYFDLDNECVFEFNNQQRRLFGKYELNDESGAIDVKWRYPRDAGDKQLNGMLRKKGANALELTGNIKNDTIRVVLSRQERPV